MITLFDDVYLLCNDIDANVPNWLGLFTRQYGATTDCNWLFCEYCHS